MPRSCETMSKTTEEQTPIPEHQQTEGEMVIELLKTFQSDLKIANEKNQALEAEIKLLNVKVNQELPAQLDRAFKDIGDNFNAITRGIEAIPRAQQSTVAAAAAQKDGEGGTIERIFNVILKKIGGEESPGSGTLSDFDKEILKTSKQIQLLSLRDMLKKTAKSAGIELAEHVVVNP